MKIALIDVIDLMGIGGYWDRQTGKYIPPKWQADECYPERGLTSEDYQRFAANPDRYLKSPVLRLGGVDCKAAIAMGNITREQLMELGYKRPEQWELFYREPTTVEGATPRCPDEDWEASKRVDEYMREHGGGEVYMAYIIMKSDIVNQLVRDWLTQHGIEYYDTSQS